MTSAVPDAEVLNITETIHAAYGIPTSDRRRRLQSAGLVRTFFTYASVGTIQLEASETLDAVALANHLGIHQSRVTVTVEGSVASYEITAGEFDDAIVVSDYQTPLSGDVYARVNVEVKDGTKNGDASARAVLIWYEYINVGVETRDVFSPSMSPSSSSDTKTDLFGITEVEYDYLFLGAIGLFFCCIFFLCTACCLNRSINDKKAKIRKSQESRHIIDDTPEHFYSTPVGTTQALQPAVDRRVGPKILSNFGGDYMSDEETSVEELEPYAGGTYEPQRAIAGGYDNANLWQPSMVQKDEEYLVDPQQGDNRRQVSEVPTLGGLSDDIETSDSLSFPKAAMWRESASDQFMTSPDTLDNVPSVPGRGSSFTNGGAKTSEGFTPTNREDSDDFKMLEVSVDNKRIPEQTAETPNDDLEEEEEAGRKGRGMPGKMNLDFLDEDNRSSFNGRSISHTPDVPLDPPPLLLEHYESRGEIPDIGSDDWGGDGDLAGGRE